MLSVPFSAESPACRGIRHLSWRIHYDCILFALRAWPPDFGDGGLVSRDSTYPVWRAGADAATMLRTGADLDIAGLNVPAGTYTLYVLVEDPENWKLIINNQSGQNGDSYDPSVDLGRVDMEMEKPPVPVENLKYTITTKGDTGKLQLEWENHIASVSFRAN